MFGSLHLSLSSDVHTSFGSQHRGTGSVNVSRVEALECRVFSRRCLRI